MFGRHPSSTGVYLNSQPYSSAKALAGAASLNQHLKDNEYLTLGCGKIYHGTQDPFADRQGWHDYGQPKDDFTLPDSAGGAQFDLGATPGGDRR